MPTATPAQTVVTALELVSRARQYVEGSMRSSWKMRAWYVQPETASRLRAM